MPPPPVVVPAPPPVHLNHVSSVNVEAPSAPVPAAGPIVTQSFVPSKSRDDAATAPTHLSVVQPFESLHCAEVVHPPPTTLVQLPPGAPTHVSVVPATPSSQFPFELQQPDVGAYQLWQTPLTHASPVQAFPSVQLLASLF